MKIPKPKIVRSAGALAQGLEHQLEGRRYVLLTDEDVSTHCLPLLGDWIGKYAPLDIIEVEAGEQCKSIEVCTQLWQHLLDLQIDKYDVLICLGGGSVCDLGGFVAATYKRGISCIFIPTTLLAMTDAAIGGKNGIDWGEAKNMVGTIVLPEQTFIYPSFCDSLPAIELVSGMAEVFKHALIGSTSLWEELQGLELDSHQPTSTILRKSIDVKLRVVKSDLLEKGERIKLNFGHTFGHAIESYYRSIDHPIAHGLAVSMGMVVDLELSEAREMARKTEAAIVKKSIRERFGMNWSPWPAWNAIEKFIQQDKKKESNSWRMAAFQDIGQTAILQDVSLYELQAAYLAACEFSSKAH